MQSLHSKYIFEFWRWILNATQKAIQEFIASWCRVFIINIFWNSEDGPSVRKTIREICEWALESVGNHFTFKCLISLRRCLCPCPLCLTQSNGWHTFHPEIWHMQRGYRCMLAKGRLDFILLITEICHGKVYVNHCFLLFAYFKHSELFILDPYIHVTCPCIASITLLLKVNLWNHKIHKIAVSPSSKLNTSI